MVVVALAVPVFGNDVAWQSATGGDFQDGTLWAGGNEPGSGDRAAFSLDADYTVTLLDDVETGLIVTDGDVTFALGGFTYTVPDVINSTFTDNGALTLLNGTMQHNRRIDMSWTGFAGSLSVLTVGANAQFLHTGSTFNIGYRYGSEVNIVDGGLLDAVGELYVGRVDGTLRGEGTVTVNGDGSALLHANGPFYVGFGGDGTLEILNSGRVEVTGTGEFRIGDVIGGVGLARVVGGDPDAVDPSRLIIAADKTVRIGAVAGSEGELRVEAGGLGTFGGPLHLGFNAASGGNPSAFGSIVVTGADSLVTTQAEFNIGNSGAGALRVESEGTLVANGLFHLGRNAGATGEATVTGTGSEIRVNALALVGRTGNGTLTVEDGGLFKTTNAATDLMLGNSAGSEGTLTVTGTGSRVEFNGNYFRVGFFGEGHLVVRDGGVVDASGMVNRLWIGERDGAVGSATVTGDGSGIALGARLLALAVLAGSEGSLLVQDSGEVTTTGSSLVGGAGHGTMRIESGGEVSVGSMNIGNSGGSLGEATVTGSVSLLAAATNIDVATSGTGTLTVEDGGKVTAGGSIAIARFAAGDGTLTVSGSTSAVELAGAAWLGVGGSAAGTEWVANPGGTGNLVVEDGAQVSTGPSGNTRFYVFDGGTLRIDGGRITAGRAMFTEGADFEVVLRLADPVNAMLTVRDEVRLYENVFLLEVGGDFVYQQDAVYRVIGFGTSNADFNRFDGMAEGDVVFAVNDAAYGFRLSYGEDVSGFVTLTAVIPEPGTAALLLIGVGAVLLRRLRLG